VKVTYVTHFAISYIAVSADVGPDLASKTKVFVTLRRKKGTKNIYFPSLALILTLTVILSPKHYTTKNFGWLHTIPLMYIAQTSCMCHTNVLMRRTTQVWH